MKIKLISLKAVLLLINIFYLTAMDANRALNCEKECQDLYTVPSSSNPSNTMAKISSDWKTTCQNTNSDTVKKNCFFKRSCISGCVNNQPNEYWHKSQYIKPEAPWLQRYFAPYIARFGELCVKNCRINYSPNTYFNCFYPQEQKGILNDRDFKMSWRLCDQFNTCLYECSQKPQI
jgi:hypothetical protein